MNFVVNCFFNIRVWYILYTIYPTTFVFVVVPSLESPFATSLPGILLWPGTQFRETELLAATSLILLRQSIVHSGNTVTGVY